MWAAERAGASDRSDRTGNGRLECIGSRPSRIPWLTREQCRRLVSRYRPPMPHRTALSMLKPASPKFA